MDFNLSKQQELIRQLMHDFAENEVKPLAAEIDDTEQFPVETVRKMAKYGIFLSSQRDFHLRPSQNTLY